MSTYDLLVVGGGINGVGIARDAAGRGLSVLLCERDDLASHTSSWSTKLIHGGLRYLEHKEFRLVREALMEREVLLNAAPHMIEPLRFILPHHKGLRPGWMLRIGLFLYDNLGGRKHLQGTERVDLQSSALGAPLADRFKFGFEYTDCRTDDSRLVALNAIDAQERGADIRTRTELISAKREGGVWHAEIVGPHGERQTVQARVLINAAGPWVTGLISRIDGVEARKKLRLVKGSHILTERLYDHDRAYIFQNADGRIVFTIPYVNDTTLIGTTDISYEGDPASASISEEETAYLCESVSEYLKTPVTPDMVVGDFSGVRPLYDDLGKDEASAVTRDYAFDIEREAGEVPLLSIYGGKLTTYRKLAEHALEKLAGDLPAASGAWTRAATLPGGEGGYSELAATRSSLFERYGFVGEQAFDRMFKAYGARLVRVLGDAKSTDELGQSFGHGLFEAEVSYLMKNEWVRSTADLLQRRSKLAPLFSAEEEQALADFIGGRITKADEAA
ncbi:MAG: glycerol-3-phosphate dehydrogenase [Parvularculaceae bacterium]|nr:glycerol-3-phosphate dehydrogenase [Parvularculaceae bacterium]